MCTRMDKKRFWPRTTAAMLLLLALAGCALPYLTAPQIPPEPTASLISQSTSTQPPSSATIQLAAPNGTGSMTPSPLSPPVGTPAPTSKPGTPAKSSAVILSPTIPVTTTITLSPTITLTPSKSLSPTRTVWRPVTFTPIPSRTPTITPTPTPPQAFLRILRPGDFSKLLSPIQVEASVSPGEDGLVLVELFGEDGRSLVRQRLDYREYIDRSIAIAPKLEFKINGAAELGRLVVSVNDRYGRQAALASTDIVLFSIGDNDFNPASSGMAPYIFRSPVADQVIKGGILAVRGLIRPVNVNPVLLELLDEKGQLLANASLKIDLPSGVLSHNPFSADLTYKVSGPTHARLVLRQESTDRIPGTVALWSIPVLLNP